MASRLRVTRDMAIMLAASFCYLASTMLVNPLIAGYSASLGATAAAMGVIAGLMNVCSLVVRPVAGNLSDRLPKRRLALAGSILMAVTCLASACIDDAASLSVLRLANGAGYALCSVTMSTWFAELLPADHIGSGMGLFGMMNALGMAIGPALGIWVMGALGYRAAFVAAGVLAAGTAVGAVFVRDASAASVAAPARGGAERGRVHIVSRAAAPFAVTIALFTIPYMATQSFLVSYTQARGIDVATGLFFPVYAAVLLVLRYALGGLFDRLPFARFLVISSLSATVSLVLLAVMRGNLAMVAAAAAMAGGYGIMCSVCQAASVRATGAEAAGLANGTYYMGLDVGMAVGPMVAGALFGTLDASWFFPAFLVFAPLALFVYALWVK